MPVIFPNVRTLDSNKYLCVTTCLSVASSVVLMEPDPLFWVWPSMEPHGSRNEEMYE